MDPEKKTSQCSWYFPSSFRALTAEESAESEYQFGPLSLEGAIGPLLSRDPCSPHWWERIRMQSGQRSACNFEWHLLVHPSARKVFPLSSPAASGGDLCVPAAGKGWHGALASHPSRRKTPSSPSHRIWLRTEPRDTQQTLKSIHPAPTSLSLICAHKTWPECARGECLCQMQRNAKHEFCPKFKFANWSVLLNIDSNGCW